MTFLRKVTILGLIIDALATLGSLPVMIEDLVLHAEIEHLFLIWLVFLLNIIAWFLFLYVYGKIGVLEKKIEKTLG